MSYDVWLEADLGGPNPITIDENINHTSNTSAMWRDAGADLLEMHGKLAGECIDSLESAVITITNNKEHYRAMEPCNKWGTVESTIGFLQKVLDLCRKAPKAKLVVHS